jgi:hypothetical protein
MLLAMGEGELTDNCPLPLQTVRWRPKSIQEKPEPNRHSTRDYKLNSNTSEVELPPFTPPLFTQP